MDTFLHKEKLRRAILKKCQDDLVFLCREWLDYPDVDNSLHGSVEKELKKSQRRKLLLMPRGTLKSHFVTQGYSIQKILRNPNIRILIANATWDNARKFLHAIKGQFNKERVYGLTRIKLDRDTQEEITVSSRTRKEIREPTIATAGLEKTMTSQHYDLIILDDLVTRDNIGTQEQIDKVIMFYKDAISLLEPNGELIIIGTRWHIADLYGWLLENHRDRFNVVHRRLVENGKIIFPQKYTFELIEEIKKDKGPYEYSAQYDNDPVDSENATFKKEWNQFYEFGLDKNGNRELVYKDYRVPVGGMNFFTTIDPALSLDSKACFTVITTCAIDNKKNIFVYDIKRQRIVPSDVVDKTFEVYAEFNPIQIGIEVVLFQKMFCTWFADEGKRRGIYLPIIELKTDTRTSKEMRIRALQPYFAAGKVFIRSDMHELIQELQFFPRGSFRDILDTLAYQLQLIYQPDEEKSKIYKSREDLMWDEIDRLDNNSKIADYDDCSYEL